MPHLLISSWYEIVRPIFFIHLLPLLQLLLSEQVLLRWIVGLIMSWQFLLHRCDIDDPTLRSCSTRPRIVNLILLLLFLLILVPLDPACEQSIEYLVDLHLLPLRRHEVSFSWWMCMDGEGIIIIVLDLKGSCGYGF